MHEVIDNRRTALSTTIAPALGEKMANFGPLTTEFTRLTFTHPKSTFRKTILWPLTFAHMLGNGHGWLAHATRGRGSTNNFNNNIQKLT